MGKLNAKAKKINKYDNLSKPQAEFDFHGRGIVHPNDVRRMADQFLEEARRRKLSKVLFITGKGLHSRHGSPVIKPMLKRYLEGLAFVVRVYEGRSDRGGSGTLEVVLEF